MAMNYDAIVVSHVPPSHRTEPPHHPLKTVFGFWLLLLWDTTPSRVVFLAGAGIIWVSHSIVGIYVKQCWDAFCCQTGQCIVSNYYYYYYLFLSIPIMGYEFLAQPPYGVVNIMMTCWFGIHRAMTSIYVNLVEESRKSLSCERELWDRFVFDKCLFAFICNSSRMRRVP